MRYLLSILMVVAFQLPPLPPPGNPDHIEPLPGQFCRQMGDPGVDAAHACECHHTCVMGTNDEGDADPNVIVPQENARCRSWCFPKHCACPWMQCP